MITGKGRVVAHIGYPTASFKAPMTYNPWFEAQGIDAIVVPLGIRPADFGALFRPPFGITTRHGALVTMPFKVAVTGLVDKLSTAARTAGAANAVLKRADGTLLGDMFDGGGFVRGPGAYQRPGAARRRTGAEGRVRLPAGGSRRGLTQAGRR